MENEIQNIDNAYINMLNEIASMKIEQEQIANISRQLEECENKKGYHLRRARQYAVNYYTEDKIKEIGRQNEKVLKLSDFDEEFYVEKFSNSANVKLEDIIYLLDKEKDIKEVVEKLNSNQILSKDQYPENSMSIMSKIYDIISRKDGVSND